LIDAAVDDLVLEVGHKYDAQFGQWICGDEVHCRQKIVKRLSNALLPATHAA
jgi:hypothetical protein